MHKILIIDDDRAVRMIASSVLTKSGFTVIEAEDGPSGIEMATHELPDLILCDLNLPGCSGYDVIIALEEEDSTAEIPIIIITGHEGITAEKSPGGAVPDDIILKPFSTVTLVNAVKLKIQRHADLKTSQREREEKLLSILESSFDLVGIADPETLHLTYLNSTGRRMLALPLDFLVADLSLPQCFAHREAATPFSIALGITRNIGAWNGEILLGRADSSPTVVQLAMHFHKAGAKLGSYLTLVAQDITKKRAQENQLRRLSSALEQCPVAIMITDTASNIEYVNPRFVQMTGYSLLEAAAHKPSIIASDAAPADAYRQIWESIAQGREWHGEVLNRRKSGELFPTVCSVTCIHNADGETTHFLAVFVDISERKAAEKERILLQNQLHEAQRLESIGQLAAGIAHEINTPTQYVSDNIHFIRKALGDLEHVLAAYTGLVQWIRAQGPIATDLALLLAPAEKVRLDYLRREIPVAISDAEEGLTRVTKIVRAMKNFSHPGQDTFTPVDLNQAIESTLTVSRNEWKYVAELVTDFDPQLPLIPCLPGEFNQVILNIVVNAAHAIADVVGFNTGKKGTISVSTRLDGNWVEIRIRDTGTGIPLHAQPHVFEQFYTTKQIGKGTGQGLALARAVIVDQHAGTLTFETQPAAGTTFIIRLPLQQTTPPNKEPRNETPPAR